MNSKSLNLPKVGQRIQFLRKSHSLTLEDLAKKSGVSKAILSQIENDKSNPTLATIWRITQALEEKIYDILVPEEKINEYEKLTKYSTPSVMSEDGGFNLKILGLVSIVNSFQWYEFEAQSGACLISSSHGKGTIESITIIKGKLRIDTNFNQYYIESGETLRFSTEFEHKLTNPGSSICHGFMVNILN